MQSASSSLKLGDASEKIVIPSLSMIVLPRPTQLSGELDDHEGAVNGLMIFLPMPTQLSGE